MTKPVFKIAVLSVLATLTAACGESPGSSPPPAAPPAPVSFVEAVAEDAPVVSELPGRVAPTRIAEVRPRVSGIVVERVFEQGSLVAAGDVLYRIDPAPFRVQVESAVATLRRAEAVQLQARQAAGRQQALRDRQIASAAQQDTAVALLAQADADVAAARANLAAAELNLDYAEVRAPIAGRIGRAAITEGALVSSSESLATIQQVDPVYVDFTQSANDLLRLRRAAESGRIADLSPAGARVAMTLDDGTPYGEEGRFLFSEADVDETTGQITLRAEMPNPRGDLLPGMYVRVRIAQGIERNAFTVPQQAVQRDAGGGAQLFLVTADDKAEMRPVRTGRTIDDRVVITEGLGAGERVVVEGFQRIRPDVQVAARPWMRPRPSAGGAAQLSAASVN